METIKTYLKHIFTSADNETFSFSKLAAFFTVATMLYEFIKVSSADFQGLGIAITGVVVALAIKHATEK